MAARHEASWLLRYLYVLGVRETKREWEKENMRIEEKNLLLGIQSLASIWCNLVRIAFARIA